jgi:Zn-dependent M28 family amino/carboxypeptidase
MVVRRAWASRLPAHDAVILQIDLHPEVSLGQNVLVGFRGSERPHELIVLGANFDHAGVNAEGETLNGANDNATGVAALLEVAAALTQVHEHLQRSVLLAFFSAERAGQQGSSMLIEDLPRLLGEEAHAVAMLSLRALGRNGHRPLLLLAGETYPTLAAVVRRYDRRELLQGPPLGLQTLPETRLATAGHELVGTREGDDVPFRRAGVPSLLLNDGLDPELYGQPDDDWKYVDAEKVARVARLVFRASYDLATDLRPTALPASTRHE